VAYERSVFVADKGNWPDFRSSSEPDRFMLSWCHGAPGILLSRLVLESVGLVDSDTSEELIVARKSTMQSLDHIRNQRGTAAHLCCGVLGLSSLLRVASHVSDEPLDPLVPVIEGIVVSDARAKGYYNFFSVDNGSLSLPGLFTGNAGVGMALLEAASGQRWLPSVLSAGLLVRSVSET
jgi:lantibiotic modifying enzyme